MPQSRFNVKDLVGIDKHIVKVESLLEIGSSEVRVVGIWGMGGIGKTTIADAVFTKLRSQFESCCFVPDVREQVAKSGLNYLRDKYLSDLLGEENLRIGTPNIGSTFVKERLSRKKVLVVFDDVNKSSQLEYLLGSGDGYFGSGSRIMVTSRDRQVFVNVKAATEVYKVPKMNFLRSRQVFSISAFKQDKPVEDLMQLTERMVNYCDGNPLALKLLGSMLCGRNKKEWESAFKKLKQAPHKDILKVLKLSYGELDDKEQSTFLDIACFITTGNLDDAEKILGDSSIMSIRILIDLSLISLIYSERNIKMHDLIREMGQQIVCQQSREPGKRSRLWCPEDVYHILKNNTGTDVVECISLDMSEIKEVHLSAAALAKMPNLRLLKFYQSRLLDNHFSSKMYIPDFLERVSDRLQLFHWDGYPCKFLPLDFSLENLVELNMCGSHLEHLWDGIQELPSLRTIVLSYSKHLTEIPDLCRAPNLQHVFLSDCEKIKKCPVVTSENMVQLDLRKTAIEEVPSSIGSLAKLKSLCLSDCELLKELPSSISNLQSLFELKFSGCLRLEKFPDITEPMENLKRLRIERTAIKELPSSIPNLVGLVRLIMLNCEDLEFIPRSFCNLNSLKVFRISDCPKIVKFPSISCGLCSLESLSVNDCINISEMPDNIGCLSSLRKLSLRGSNIESIPASIELLTNLRRLYLSYSKRLQSLPILPPSLIHLDAIDCPLLYGNIMAKAELAIRYCLDERRSFEGIFPGSEVPRWFPYQSMGPSLTIKWIRPNWGTAEFCGFVVCIVFSVGDEIRPWEHLFQCKIKIGDHPVEQRHFCCLRSYSRRFKKDHTIVSYDPSQNFEFDYSLPRGGSDDYHDVTFTILSWKDTFKLKKFGIYLTFSPDQHKEYDKLTVEEECDKPTVKEDDEDMNTTPCSVM